MTHNPSCEQPVPSAPAPQVLACSAMHTQYGAILRALFARLFRPIDYPKQVAEKIRSLACRGTIVYIGRDRSTLRLLYYNHALGQQGLPLAALVAGINLIGWQPLGRLWQVWRQRHVASQNPWRQRYGDEMPSKDEALLADIVGGGEAAFVCLPLPRRTATSQGEPIVPPPNKMRSDFLRALVAVQRTQGRPIFLVPHVLIDRRHIGIERQNPGRLRLLWMFFSSLRKASVRLGEIIDLQELCHSSEAGDGPIARKVSHQLNRSIDAEIRVVSGPQITPRAVIRRHVLRDAAVRAAINKAHSDNPQKKVEQFIDEIAANYRVGALVLMERIMRWVFHLIYDGIVVDSKGLGRVIEASRNGPLVFCPSHRSHIDYLVLSYILWNHGHVAPPHIAAGANLSFFPLGNIARGCGGFFIRRSFRNDPLYAAVLNAYIKELVHNGASLEFFPEGTRSRTGKVLMPRFGMFTMAVDAWRKGANPGGDLLFVPVSIDYERIIEAHHYEQELSGTPKKAESVRGLLRSVKILRSRYGRVSLQFGAPISLQTIAKDAGLGRNTCTTEDAKWRHEIERLGYRVLYQVATLTSVTPTALVATALLGTRDRCLPHAMLFERCDWMIDFLAHTGARLSRTVIDPHTRCAALTEAVHRLVDERLVLCDSRGPANEPSYRVPAVRRLQLDYFKNSLMNLFAPASILARCLVRRSAEVNHQGPIPLIRLQTDTRFLSRLLKREFLYAVDVKFDSHFERTLASFEARGYIARDEKGVCVLAPQSIRHLAELLDGFVEAYWITSRTLLALRAFPMWEQEIEQRAFDVLRQSIAKGEIHRPEAANPTLVKGAIAWHLKAGIIERHNHIQPPSMELTSAYSGSSATATDSLKTLIDDIGAYV